MDIAIVLMASQRKAHSTCETIYVALTLIFQVVSLPAAVLICIFYLGPEHLVLGTRVSALVFIFGIISPYLSWFKVVEQYRDAYLRFVVLHNRGVFFATACMVLGLGLWGVVMFSEIRNRYIYLETIDEAVTLVNSDQIAMPRPELLAAAFQLMPERPEAPFIISRAVRILAPDDNLGPFHDYMKRFTAALDRGAISSRKRGPQERARISVDAASDLPRLDPLELLVQYSIEAPEVDQRAQYQWALSVLDNALAQGPDPSLSLYRTSLELALKLDVDPIPRDQRLAYIESKIALLRTEIDDILTVNDRGWRSPLIDQVYQEALDDLAVLMMQLIELQATSPAPGPKDASGPAGAEACGISVQDDIPDIFSRLLLIRRRLMTSDQVIWWRPPQKLTLYHIFLRLGGLRDSEGAKYESSMNKYCPAVWKQIQQMYASPAFRVFQDPEQWTAGTPLSSAFNGAGAANQLRKWLQLGW